MVLATREVPGIQLGHWAWLTVWTLVGGTLAAGSANAINCYLDRDIDELMVRTRRRPLPAHQVDPERAVVFGLVLGVDLVRRPGLVRQPPRGVPRPARDRVLRRRLHDRHEADDAPEHRHRRGGRGAAAGHRLGGGHGQRRGPGAAPVRARLLLDAAPLLGAVAPDPQGLRRGRRADAAGRPGRRRDDAARSGCTRSSWSRSRSSSGRSPGWASIYLVAAVVLGAIFLRQAYLLWRQGSSEEGSTAGAIRLYKYSITLPDAALRRDRDRRDRRDPARLALSPTAQPNRSTQSRRHSGLSYVGAKNDVPRYTSPSFISNSPTMNHSSPLG